MIAYLKEKSRILFTVLPFSELALVNLRTVFSKPNREKVERKVTIDTHINRYPACSAPNCFTDNRLKPNIDKAPSARKQKPSKNFEAISLIFFPQVPLKPDLF